MPLVIIRTSAPVPEAKKEEILKGATKVLVDTGRAESHVMVLLEKVDGAMGGKVGPVACVEMHSMGNLTHELNHRVSEGMTALLEKTLGLNKHNVYLNFMPVAEGAWGWEGGIVIYKFDQKKWIIE